MRMACVQTDVVFNDPAANLAVAEGHLRELAAQGVKLVVFPEAFLTGYCARSEEEAKQIAIRCHCAKDFDITDAHEAVYALQGLSVELDVHIVFGLIASDDYGLMNCAVLAEPNGRLRRYVKTHLPYLGVDRFVDPGDSLPVFQTEIGAIGILVCYDLRPPEAARVLALAGAELIVLPTNWPTRKGTTPAIMCPARAAENKVFFASCNRIGDENGFSFRGESAIYDCGGGVIVEAGTEEKVIVADLDLAEARNKHTVIIPGAFESNAVTSRRPELYKSLIQ